MKIVNKTLRELKPYENNPRNNDGSVLFVANSIREFGFKVPIVIDKNDVIVAGHTRFEAAKHIGLNEVPCIVADDLTEEQIKAFRLADNKVGEHSRWDFEKLEVELSEIIDLDMEDFGFEIELPDVPSAEEIEDEDYEDELPPRGQHNVFENQERAQFPCAGFYGIPQMRATHTVHQKMLRFMDWKEVDDLSDYVAHFYYDDYKFMSAWRDPDKYIDKLRQFKAVVAPDFSLYTDFPRALQILSCYRRQWVGAYWQSKGIDVIPDVVWGDKESFKYCFDGIPEGGTVAVSTIGIKTDPDWNDKMGDMFRAGYKEMMKRLAPETVLFYGDMFDGLDGNIIRIPSYYEQKRKILNARMEERKNGQREE